MKAKLIKHEVDYYCLLNDKGEVIADVNGGDIYKLSLKNCQAIECEYDLDELANKYLQQDIYEQDKEILDTKYSAFKEGFQKALELMGDKKFSEEQMLQAFLKGVSLQIDVPTFQQSLQQNEWDVEICCYVEEDNDSDSFSSPMLTSTGEPKLDADGCLILKRVV